MFSLRAAAPGGSPYRELPMPDQDRIEGAAKNIGGKLKEAAGKLTGDEKLKAEGRADQVAGKVQNAVGGVKDALKGDKG
ncbi:hypothetical protein GCM10009434_27620 [Brevundimonas olei]